MESIYIQKYGKEDRLTMEGFGNYQEHTDGFCNKEEHTDGFGRNEEDTEGFGNID